MSSLNINLPDIDHLKKLVLDYSQQSYKKLSENRKIVGMVAAGCFLLLIASKLSRNAKKRSIEKDKKFKNTDINDKLIEKSIVIKKDDDKNSKNKKDKDRDNDDDDDIDNATNTNKNDLLISNVNISEIKSNRNTNNGNSTNTSMITVQSKNFRVFSISSQNEFILNISYTLFFHLKEKNEYIGICDIRFDLLDSPLLNKEGIILEWDGDKILYMSINDIIIENTSILWDGRYIIIPPNYVEIDTQNIIIIKFLNKYMTNNQKKGLVVYNESILSSIGNNENKHAVNQYIYTISQINCMHCIFPCFDQPNMKANFNLLIYAPEEWSVISNQSLINVSNAKYEICREIKVYIKNTDDNIGQDYVLNSFLTIKNLPPHLFGFCCGQFNQTNYSLNQHINSHLRLYYPMTEFYTDMADIIKNETEKSLFIALKFAAKYTGISYPHTKCDVIIIPGLEQDFLELPGCIFIADYVFGDSKPNLDERINRIISIMHPIFKIWFGYFIAIQNTEEYWLFEGLALHLTFECMTINSESLTLGPRDDQPCHSEDFLIALSWIKQKLYQAELSSPINFFAPPSDIQQFSMRGIKSIYSLRNACLIKQLRYMVSSELLNNSIQRIFAKFSWKTLSIQEFLDFFSGMINRANQNMLAISHDKFINAASFDISKFNMNTWAEHWLYSPGINILELEWDKSNEMFKNLLKIKQSNRNRKKSINRTFLLKMALFNQDLEKYKVKEFYVEDRNYNDIILEDLQRIPTSILLNYHDESYVIIKFKSDEINFFKQNFSKLQDIFSISEILNIFKNNVYLCTLYILDYIELTEIYLQMSLTLSKHRYHHPHIIYYVLNSIHDLLEHYMPIKLKRDMGTRLLKFILKLLMDMNIGNKKLNNHESLEEIIYILNDNIIDFIYTNETFELVYDYLKDYLNIITNKNLVKLLELSYYFKASEYCREKLKRICLNHQYTVCNYNEEYISNKLKYIGSDKLHRQELWSTFINIDYINNNNNHRYYNLIKCQMEGFNYMGCSNQYHSNYTKEFFNVYKYIIQYTDLEYSRMFFKSLYPNSDDISNQIEELEIILTYDTENTRLLKPIIKKKIEELQLKYEIFKFNKFL